MARLDTDGDGSVSFPEFCAWWDVGLSMEKLLHPSFGRQLARTRAETFFRRHAGSDLQIDAAELGGLCAQLGQELTEEQIQLAMAKLDVDGDGTVGFEEFLVWWDAGLEVATLLDPKFNRRLGQVGSGPADAVIRRSAAIQAVRLARQGRSAGSAHSLEHLGSGSPLERAASSQSEFLRQGEAGPSASPDTSSATPSTRTPSSSTPFTSTNSPASSTAPPKLGRVTFSDEHIITDPAAPPPPATAGGEPAPGAAARQSRLPVVGRLAAFASRRRQVEREDPAAVQSEALGILGRLALGTHAQAGPAPQTGRSPRAQVRPASGFYTRGRERDAARAAGAAAGAAAATAEPSWERARRTLAMGAGTSWDDAIGAASDEPSTPSERRPTAAMSAEDRSSLVAITTALAPPPPPGSALARALSASAGQGATSAAAVAKGVNLVRTQLAARGVHSSTHGRVVDDAAIAEELRKQGGHVGRTVNRLKSRAERSEDSHAQAYDTSAARSSLVTVNVGEGAGVQPPPAPAASAGDRSSLVTVNVGEEAAVQPPPAPGQIFPDVPSAHDRSSLVSVSLPAAEPPPPAEELVQLTKMVELVRTPLGLGLRLGDDGLGHCRVVAIGPDSQAGRSGAFAVHDRIVALNGHPLTSYASFKERLAAIAIGGKVRIEIAVEIAPAALAAIEDARSTGGAVGGAPGADRSSLVAVTTPLPPPPPPSSASGKARALPPPSTPERAVGGANQRGGAEWGPHTPTGVPPAHGGGGSSGGSLPPRPGAVSLGPSQADVEGPASPQARQKEWLAGEITQINLDETADVGTGKAPLPPRPRVLSFFPKPRAPSPKHVPSETVEARLQSEAGTSSSLMPGRRGASSPRPRLSRDAAQDLATSAGTPPKVSPPKVSPPKSAVLETHGPPPTPSPSSPPTDGAVLDPTPAAMRYSPDQEAPQVIPARPLPQSITNTQNTTSYTLQRLPPLLPLATERRPSLTRPRR